MVKETVLYGFGVAVSRASVFIYLPLLTGFLTLGEFGSYILVTTAVQLVIPLLSLNSAAAIMREGSEFLSAGRELTNRFNGIILAVISVGVLMSWYGRAWWGVFPFYTILLAGMEALQANILTHLRCQHSAVKFLVFSSLKAAGALVAIVYAFRVGGDLRLLLGAMVVVGVMISVLMLAAVGLFPTFQGQLALVDQLAYSVPLIPHIFGQWVMNGSDKFVVKLLGDSTAVGKYGIAYSLAMVVMVLNSGIALALPTYFIQNTKLFFEQEKGARLYYALYTTVYLGIVFAMFGLVKLDKLYFGFLRVYDREVLHSTVLVAYGFYFLGLYYMYANVLFYYRRSSRLSLVTLVGAVLNVVLTFTFVSALGYLGAALATLLTYAAYTALVWISSRTVRPIVMNPKSLVKWIAIAGAWTFIVPLSLGLI